jgi:RNA polymerase sigma factor (TIGR02999 family)
MAVPNVTELLVAWQRGDRQALDELVAVTYRELRRAARRQMAGERPGHVLQTTALVNEAYLRLVPLKETEWQNRAHFFAVAANVMRRILLNWARDQGRAKRGGQALRVSLSGVADVAVRRREDLIALDDALEDLEAIDPRKSRVVELRYFAGLSLEETADVLHVSVATVRRDWSLARAWLQRALGAPGGRRSAAAGAQR